MIKIEALTTEMRNDNSVSIDQMSTREILKTINDEDKTVASRVEAVLPEIAASVEIVYESLLNGGRLFYVGAGTSGRLGILDAVECPPTFRTPPELVQGIMAGGSRALVEAVEGAEDDPHLAARDLSAKKLDHDDVVVGIAASGRTPYVVGALQYAKQIGAKTICLSSNQDSIISRYSDIAIEVMTGPEVITGSTRMKAATAHKLILNMITTSSMIKLGKVYENLMVDVNASNVKLKERAKNIVSTITNEPYPKVEEILEMTNYEVKPAIVMIKAGVNLETAKRCIKLSNGFVREAIQVAQQEVYLNSKNKQG
ncbi:N-acetylmuramic acid 6-phosphate etherase [Bacillus timonensis]|uniref:N-acetylmuramic acid 6-phosphate etherase n=1 Tax=Bacillus timonensis TaxID=1033734 RepID=A0A4S3PVF5_9BACI|nr:N-acetylmuramic acid 6-phosphate etherase [Bacillus timonensis]THE13800.1 N-acetylmuramic acid 6-phosphate etherase [Bacillus timonensis]